MNSKIVLRLEAAIAAGDAEALQHLRREAIATVSKIDSHLNDPSWDMRASLSRLLPREQVRRRGPRIRSEFTLLAAELFDFLGKRLWSCATYPEAKPTSLREKRERIKAELDHTRELLRSTIALRKMLIGLRKDLNQRIREPERKFCNVVAGRKVSARLVLQLKKDVEPLPIFSKATASEWWSVARKLLPVIYGRHWEQAEIFAVPRNRIRIKAKLEHDQLTDSEFTQMTRRAIDELMRQSFETLAEMAKINSDPAYFRYPFGSLAGTIRRVS